MSNLCRGWLVVVVVVLASCSKAPPSEPAPAPPPGPRLIDASVADSTPIPQDARSLSDPIPIRPLAIVGPYATIEASCATARPCGETGDMTTGAVVPAKTPDCRAVLDPSGDPIGRQVPSAFGDGAPQLRRLVGKRQDELRIGGVLCAVPEGIRGEATEHYVFVHRKDGWWRTERPVMSWSYNEKYCGGGMYVKWNVDDARTIIGIAAGHGCLACGKQGNEESVTELMVRVETAGPKPLVFAPLVVGFRQKTTRMEPFDDPTMDPRYLNDPDCKIGQHAISMTEDWQSTDEVVLAGGTGTSGPIDTPIEISSTAPLAAPGRYRFAR